MSIDICIAAFYCGITPIIYFIHIKITLITSSISKFYTVFTVADMF